jgi:hypothetical protein
LESIKVCHLIDQQLRGLIGAVTDEGLRERMLAVQNEWREVAYALSAYFCGVEVGVLPASTRKRKMDRRKGEDSREHEDLGAGQNPPPVHQTEGS